MATLFTYLCAEFYVTTVWLNKFVVGADISQFHPSKFHIFIKSAYFIKNCDSVVCSQIGFQ